MFGYQGLFLDELSEQKLAVIIILGLVVRKIGDLYYFLVNLLCQLVVVLSLDLDAAKKGDR